MVEFNWLLLGLVRKRGSKGEFYDNCFQFYNGNGESS